MNRAPQALDLLVRIAEEYRPATLASSLSVEDMVLTDLIAREALPVEVFVLDTGRLHGDTLGLIGRIEERYGISVLVRQPEPADVARYEAEFGRDAFYRDPDLRRRCCEIRKVEPLKRALAGKRAWITGLRREQSPARGGLTTQEPDAVHGIAKFNPLADWSESEVRDYIRVNSVPYNPLYDQGYRSIGCAPCTRPVVTGEDARAGRWWWEIKTDSECGIHIRRDGRLTHARAAAA